MRQPQGVTQEAYSSQQAEIALERKTEGLDQEGKPKPHKLHGQAQKDRNLAGGGEEGGKVRPSGFFLRRPPLPHKVTDRRAHKGNVEIPRKRGRAELSRDKRNAGFLTEEPARVHPQIDVKEEMIDSTAINLILIYHHHLIMLRKDHLPLRPWDYFPA